MEPLPSMAFFCSKDFDSSDFDPVGPKELPHRY